MSCAASIYPNPSLGQSQAAALTPVWYQQQKHWFSPGPGHLSHRTLGLSVTLQKASATQENGNRDHTLFVCAISDTQGTNRTKDVLVPSTATQCSTCSVYLCFHSKQSTSGAVFEIDLAAIFWGHNADTHPPTQSTQIWGWPVVIITELHN